MRLTILGLGLIGGSIARAVAARRRWPVTAWDADPAPLRLARRTGVAHGAPDPESAVAGAEIVVLAVPTLALPELLTRLGPALARTGATVTDVASTKQAVLTWAAAIPSLRFVGGHPMSGGDSAGFAASTVDLFAGRPWVVVRGRGARHRDVERVRALARGCGARPIELEAAEHDRAVAAISHLPLVVSAALAEASFAAPEWPTARGLAAQGFRDLTRLARGSPALGLGMLATNRQAVLDALDRLEVALAAWRARLESLPETPAVGPATTEPPAEALAARLAEVAARLRDEVRLP